MKKSNFQKIIEDGQKLIKIFHMIKEDIIRKENIIKNIEIIILKEGINIITIIQNV